MCAEVLRRFREDITDAIRNTNERAERVGPRVAPLKAPAHEDLRVGASCDGSTIIRPGGEGYRVVVNCSLGPGRVYAAARGARKGLGGVERIFPRTVAFFDAPDGDDGGLPFGVFDVRTGRKLFGDSSLLDHYQETLHIKNTFRITSRADQIPLLTYLRVVRAACDLRTEQADCWNKVRAKFSIPQTDIPVCSWYEEAEGRWESAIVYPVSILLTDSPQIKAVDGPVFCWPTD